MNLAGAIRDLYWCKTLEISCGEITYKVTGRFQLYKKLPNQRKWKEININRYLKRYLENKAHPKQDEYYPDEMRYYGFEFYIKPVAISKYIKSKHKNNIKVGVPYL